MTKNSEEQPQSGTSKPVKQFRASSRPSFRGQHSASASQSAGNNPNHGSTSNSTNNNASANSAGNSGATPQFRTRRERLANENRRSAHAPNAPSAPPTPTTPPPASPPQATTTPAAAQPAPQASTPQAPHTPHQPEPPAPRNRPQSVNAQDHVNAQQPRPSAGSRARATVGNLRTRTRSTLDNLRTRKPTEGERHTKQRYDAFPKVVGWTSLGTLLPGLAMIRKNRNSKLGWFLLIGFFAGILVTGIMTLALGPIRVVARVISSPTILNILAFLLLAGLIIWVLVIIRSYIVSSRGTKMSDQQRILSGVLVVSLMLIVAIPLGVGGAYSKVSSHTVSKIFGNGGAPVGPSKEQIWADKPRINVFLIGRDNGENRTGTRPDTMLVASIDTQSGKSTLISVPRNLTYPVFPEDSKLAQEFPDGFNALGEESLINSVWSWAEDNPESVGDPHGLETGMWATMQAVEGSLGINLDYWASVDMQGFRDLVNAMGGVKIDVERPIPMGGGENQHTGAKNRIFGWIDPGEQKLSGMQALWYVRSRDGSDNYDRMCRQQRMLKTTLEQVNPSELALKFPQLANSSTKNVATDVNQKELGGFVELAWEMKNTKIKSAQINNEVTPTYRPDYDKLHQWVKDQIDPQKPSQKEETKGGGDKEEEPQPTEEPTEETGAPAPGIEDNEGKCYPSGYNPGDPWPGYPGPGNHGEH